MRRVKVYKWEKLVGDTYVSKVDDGKALFHQWGVSYEEFETGPGNFSTAIIERGDGTVENVAAENISFLD